ALAAHCGLAAHLGVIAHWFDAQHVIRPILLAGFRELALLAKGDEIARDGLSAQEDLAILALWCRANYPWIVTDRGRSPQRSRNRHGRCPKTAPNDAHELLRAGFAMPE